MGTKVGAGGHAVADELRSGVPARHGRQRRLSFGVVGAADAEDWPKNAMITLELVQKIVRFLNLRAGPLAMFAELAVVQHTAHGAESATCP